MIDDLRSGPIYRETFKSRSLKDRESEIHDTEHVDTLVR
jgi:hypothetical protein